jgi:hypothetical protein
VVDNDRLTRLLRRTHRSDENDHTSNRNDDAQSSAPLIPASPASRLRCSIMMRWRLLDFRRIGEPFRRRSHRARPGSARRVVPAIHPGNRRHGERPCLLSQFRTRRLAACAVTTVVWNDDLDGSFAPFARFILTTDSNAVDTPAPLPERSARSLSVVSPVTINRAPCRRRRCRSRIHCS